MGRSNSNASNTVPFLIDLSDTTLPLKHSRPIEALLAWERASGRRGDAQDERKGNENERCLNRKRKFEMEEKDGKYIDFSRGRSGTYKVL